MCKIHFPNKQTIFHPTNDFLMLRIGLLSDTHSFLDETIFDYFDECDEIWHAGDIGDPRIADRLEAFRPFRAVFGNIDDKDIRLALSRRFALQRRRFGGHDDPYWRISWQVQPKGAGNFTRRPSKTFHLRPLSYPEGDARPYFGFVAHQSRCLWPGRFSQNAYHHSFFDRKWQTEGFAGGGIGQERRAFRDER